MDSGIGSDNYSSALTLPFEGEGRVGVLQGNQRNYRFCQLGKG